MKSNDERVFGWKAGGADDQENKSGTFSHFRRNVVKVDPDPDWVVRFAIIPAIPFGN
jgi:hypothetical protein